MFSFLLHSSAHFSLWKWRLVQQTRREEISYFQSSTSFSTVSLLLTLESLVTTCSPIISAKRAFKLGTNSLAQRFWNFPRSQVLDSQLAPVLTWRVPTSRFKRHGTPWNICQRMRDSSQCNPNKPHGLFEPQKSHEKTDFWSVSSEKQGHLKWWVCLTTNSTARTQNCFYFL